VSSSLSLRRPAVALCLALALGGCSLFVPPKQIRGNRVSPSELSQLVPGTTTEAGAREVLGSPTAHDTFDPNNWYYITEMTRPVIGGTHAVLDQDVVVLSFDTHGVLEKIHRINRRDALAAPIVARTTPSPGSSASFLQQLLGNIGSVGPGVGAGSGGGSGTSIGGAP
jgi:outer membrane protein assembly factor BamE (lipoprotein component of BamABCDE complex)